MTCDSLAYLSHEGMMQAVGSATGEGFCSACFTGNYPVPLGAAAPGDLVQLRSLRPARV